MGKQSTRLSKVLYKKIIGKGRFINRVNYFGTINYVPVSRTTFAKQVDHKNVGLLCCLREMTRRQL